jgi:hypothetical protein
MYEVDADAGDNETAGSLRVLRVFGPHMGLSGTDHRFPPNPLLLDCEETVVCPRYSPPTPFFLPHCRPPEMRASALGISDLFDSTASDICILPLL